MRVLKITDNRYLVVSENGAKVYKEFTNRAAAEAYKQFLVELNKSKRQAEQGVTK